MQAADHILAGASMMDVARHWTAKGIKAPAVAVRGVDRQTVSQVMRSPTYAPTLLCWSAPASW